VSEIAQLAQSAAQTADDATGWPPKLSFAIERANRYVRESAATKAKAKIATNAATTVDLYQSG